MIRINCPWCGVRNMTEFNYGGDAINKHPGLSEEISKEQYTDYINKRNNPAGEHIEYWQHTNGCRQWLKVKRDTLTHEVFDVVAANTAIDGEQQ